MTESSLHKPFPWTCNNCHEKDVYYTRTPYSCKVKFKEQIYNMEIPDLEVAKCRKCGELIFDEHADSQLQFALFKIIINNLQN